MMKRSLILLALFLFVEIPQNVHAAAQQVPEGLENFIEFQSRWIPGYRVQLKCTNFDSYQTDKQGRLYWKGKAINQATLIFSIQREGKEIGQIMAAWYPKGQLYDQSADAPYAHTLRIYNAYIGEDNHPINAPVHPLHQKGYGTEALETLSEILKTSEMFPKDTEVWVECPLLKPHLVKLGERFGLEKKHTPRSLLDGGVQYMAVPLDHIRCPLQEKREAEKAAASKA